MYTTRGFFRTGVQTQVSEQAGQTVYQLSYTLAQENTFPESFNIVLSLRSPA